MQKQTLSVGSLVPRPHLRERVWGHPPDSPSMHTASYEFFVKPKESAGCHQILSSWVGSGDETTLLVEVSVLVVCWSQTQATWERKTWDGYKAIWVESVRVYV